MSPSSGQAIIWRTIQDSNLKSSDYESGALTLLSYANNLVQGSCAAGVDVSCGASLPKSPDRIAGIKKPKALTSGLNSLCVDNRSYGDDIRFT